MYNNKSNSIQAVSVIVDKNNGIASRLFYTISFIFTTAAFFYYVFCSYEKWKIEPDIAVRKHQIRLGEIPFPALTICSPVFARSETMRYKMYSSLYVKKYPEVLDNITSSEANYLISNQHACNPYYIDFSKRVQHLRTKSDVVKLMSESFLETDDVLISCIYGSRQRICDNMFNRVLTDRGFCYSFNMQGFNTIFNGDIISDDFLSYKRKDIFKSPKFKLQSAGYVDDDNETINWTLEKGFNDELRKEFIPVAAGKGATVAAFIYLKKRDYDNICGVFTNVFNYYLHLPNEIPTHFHKKQFIRFHEQSYVTLTAMTYKTSEDLRELKPAARGCYFEGERKLKFFKSYTKTNCDFECVANFTLKMCGCVKFSMPREKNTPVCDFDKSRCYYAAMTLWPGFNTTTMKVMDSCDCLKTCTDIKYSISSEESSKTKVTDHESFLQNGVAEE
jgi:amiloride-sensitive sodium channel